MNDILVTPGLIHRYMQDGSRLEDFLKTHFSKGATPREILYDKNCNLEIAHALVHYISLTPEEFGIYLNLCDIHGGEPQTIFDSHEVIDSKHIIGSSKVNNSEFIRFSSVVSNSSIVYNSTTIDHSNYVYRSHQITDSEFVMNSNTCLNSDQLVNCTNVQWTSHAHNSQDLDECRMVYNCNKLTRCDWSFGLKNCTNCIFCAGLNGANLQVFNQEVDAAEFETYYNYLSDLDWDSVRTVTVEKRNGLYSFMQMKSPKDFFNKNLNGFEEIKGWARFKNDLFGWNFFN